MTFKEHGILGGRVYDLLDDFCTVHIKEREFFLLVEDWYRSDIRPDHIERLNGAAFVETTEGRDFRAKITSVTFNSVQNTIRFLWFNRNVLDIIKAHYWFVHLELFEAGALPCVGVHNTINYFPASEDAIGEA